MADSTHNRPQLSVAMIVRDAQAALAETLHSIRQIADEIVICDTGSTDGTVPLARNAATKVVQRPWDDDFSAARNECLAHCCGDWVLWLDAGESLDEQDGPVLREFLKGMADPAKAYMMLVKVPPAGPSVAAEQIARLRLVPNHPGVRFAGAVRESVAASLAENGIAVEGVACSIHRGQREHDAEVKTQKARRDLKITDRQIAQSGESARLLNCKAEAYSHLGEPANAAVNYRRAVEISERGSTDMLEAYYGLLTSLEEAGGTGSQLTVALEALTIFPLDTQLLCAMGGYLQGQGRTDLATRSYETAYKHGQVNPQTWHLQEIREFTATCFGIALQLQQKDDEARQVFEEALAANETSVRLRRHLVDLHVKRAEREEALAQIDLLPPQTPGVEALRSAVKGACLASEKNWIAARGYLNAAYAADCRDPLCLRWLCITLLMVGEVDRARQILEGWEKADPANLEVRQLVATVEDTRRQTAAPAEDASAPASQEALAPVRFPTEEPTVKDDEKDPDRNILRIDEGDSSGTPDVPLPKTPAVKPSSDVTPRPSARP